MRNPNAESELRLMLSDLLLSQSVGVLATQGSGQPFCSLMAYAFTEQLDMLLFATKRATLKYSNMAVDGRVSILIDNRSQEDRDFQGTIAATATGKASEVADEEREPLENLYLARHPHLGDFLAEPNCAFMKMEVDSYHVVTKFQDVMQLDIRR